MARKPSPQRRLADLAERYWRNECRESTLTAVLAGERSDAPWIFREAPEDAVRRDRAAAAFLAELDAIDTGTLGLQDRITAALLRRELCARRQQFAVDAHLKPWLLPAGPEFNAIFFANSTALPTADDAALYVRRLESIDGYLRDIEASMRLGLARGHRYPLAVIDGALPALRAAATADPATSAWLGPFRRSACATPAFARWAEAAGTAVREVVLPALGRYADFVAGPLRAGARATVSCCDDPGGEGYYRAFVRYFTTGDDSPDAIHALGLSEVERIEGELAAVAHEAGFADAAAYREHLAGPGFIAASAEALRHQFEVLCKRIDGRIPAFFANLPRITYGIESMPEAMARSMPPAYAQPSPADQSSAGLFWITSLPERCPSYMHLPIALHEAWPGHLMHIAMLQEAADLPAFRRHSAVKYTVAIEGWALYCETLGIEMGLYERPDQHFGRLQMEMWRAVRLVVDTGLHWRRWSRARAIAYFTSKVALPGDTIAQEIDRYIALPGQALAYQIGNLKMRELRARAEAALGPRFAVRDFHAALIGGGAATLPVLDMIVDDWIARTLAGETRVAA